MSDLERLAEAQTRTAKFFTVAASGAASLLLLAFSCRTDQPAYEIPSRHVVVEAPATCISTPVPGGTYAVAREDKDTVVVESVWCEVEGGLARFERTYSVRGNTRNDEPWKEVTRILYE